ncbi:hypothetical protein E6W39_02810 [Kitasatospora acidiphila]|uniref:Uncharacterized protein n=1 Tax=Kitasatospora acidiphila TaxID=2567942 RepID=A0A540VX72_9ACTN|nr:hypothetical protein [Kitasatospora acidiphila]TQF01362.1 hypothetical protein E6W39_02810 [Kitasatospora acidiphila]
MTGVPPIDAPSHVYYFQVGTGTWHGSFAFRVTSWSRLRAGRIGLRNTVLVAVMQLTQWVTGKSQLASTIVAKPSEGAFGEADNTVRLSKFGVTQYLLRESYVLDPDGTGVTVHAKEQFGPVPGILSRSFTYPAEIHEGGLSSTYHMPLLGDQWTATYHVAPGHDGLAGHLVCGWAIATEEVRRVATSPGPAAG